MSRAACPTCGEKRYVNPEFGECHQCRETTNLLRGRVPSPGAGADTYGEMRDRPYDTEKTDPFTP